MTLTELIATKTGSLAFADVKQWLEEQVDVPNPELVTSRTVMAKLTITEAATLFATLKAVAASSDPSAPLVSEAWGQLQRDGIDLSHANAKAMIDALFAPELAAKVKALGVKTIARWQQTGLPRLKDGYILEVL